MAAAPDFNTAFKKLLLSNQGSSDGEQRNENVCPKHSPYALPSLTLQNNGCLSCAALNSSAKQDSSLSHDRLHMEQQEGRSLEPCRENNYWRAPGGNPSLRRPRGRGWTSHKGNQRAQSWRSSREEDARINELFNLSRTFCRETEYGNIEIFDGAGVNPYPENIRSSRNEEGGTSLSSSRCSKNASAKAQADEMPESSYSTKSYSSRRGYNKHSYQNMRQGLYE